YQIWLLPNEQGLEPEYEQRRFGDALRADKLLLAASGDGRDDSMRIHQDADILLGTLSGGTAVEHALRTGRALWLQTARGQVEVRSLGSQSSASDGGTTSAKLAAGDAATLVDAAGLQITALDGEAEVILFDLA